MGRSRSNTRRTSLEIVDVSVRCMGMSLIFPTYPTAIIVAHYANIFQWGLSMCIVLIIVQFYLALWPLGGTTNAKDFFANYVSIIVVIFIYLGARAYYRGAWFVALKDIDLDHGRRFYLQADPERAKGAKGAMQKVVGVIFN